MITHDSFSHHSPSLRPVAAVHDRRNTGHHTLHHLFTIALCMCATLLFLLAPSLSAEEEVDEIRAENLEKTAAWFAEQEAAASTNEQWETLPRIRIDREEPSVTFKAEATGLDANEIVEFYLIGERSGNAYEAIAVALAEPDDIAKAIEKMGLPRGLHANPGELRFWPQGERVHVYLDDYYAADLLLDQRTGSTAKRSGFVFTASRYVTRNEEEKLAAQVEPPFSIVSNYNEPNTILDVPFRAPQSEVYAEQVQNPDIRFDPGKLLKVRIIPERTDGSKRVQEMDLTLTAVEQTTQELPIADVRFTLEQAQDGETQIHAKEVNLAGFVEKIRSLVAEEKDPFLTVHFDHDMLLAQANSAARMLEAMENEENVRIQPPPQESLFYRAFMPDEARRDRDNRTSHPWELHLAHDEAPTLVHIKEEWIRGQARPRIEAEDITITEPQNLSDKMRELRASINAVFMYAPADMRIAEIMDYVQHFRETHPLIHVFIDPPPRDQTSDAIPAETSE